MDATGISCKYMERDSGEKGGRERERKRDKSDRERERSQTSSSLQPIGLAGHTATLTPDGRLVVVGGVNGDLHLSPSTLLYHVLNNAWELLPIRTLGLPGRHLHHYSYLFMLKSPVATNEASIFIMGQKSFLTYHP